MVDTTEKVKSEIQISGITKELHPIYSRSHEVLAGIITDKAKAVEAPDGAIQASHVLGTGLIEEHPQLDRLFFSKGGVWSSSKSKSNRLHLLCSLFSVIGRSTDRDGLPVLVLSIRDPHGKTSPGVLARSTIAAGGKEMAKALTNLGVTLTTDDDGRDLLQELLTWIEPPPLVIAHQMGWLSDLSAFALPGEIIGNAASSPVILHKDATRNLNVGQRGKYEDWKRDVAEACRGNSRLIFSLSCGVAAPLLPFAPVGSFLVHLYGESSIGKSITQIVGGSTSGGSSDDLGYSYAFDATTNAHMHRAGRHNGTLVCIDELKLLPSDNVNRFVYQTSGGRGRDRLNPDESAKSTQTWRTVTLTTGEITFQEAAKDARKGNETWGGVDARLIQIPADAATGHGIFDTIHGAPDSRRFAQEIKAAAKRNYGHVLPAFVERLMEYRDEVGGEEALRDRIRDRIEKQLKLFGLKPDTANHVHRSAEAAATVGVAGTMAAEWGLLGTIQPTEVQDAVTKCFGDSLKARGGTGSVTDHTVVMALRDYLRANDALFPEVTDEKSSYGHHESNPARGISGYKKKFDGEWYYLVFSATISDIRKAAPRGDHFEPLKKLDMVKHNPGRRDYRTRVHGQSMALFTVSSRIKSLTDEGLPPQEGPCEDDPEERLAREVVEVTRQFRGNQSKTKRKAKVAGSSTAALL